MCNTCWGFLVSDLFFPVEPRPLSSTALYLFVLPNTYELNVNSKTIDFSVLVTTSIFVNHLGFTFNHMITCMTKRDSNSSLLTSLGCMILLCTSHKIMTLFKSHNDIHILYSKYQKSSPENGCVS